MQMAGDWQGVPGLHWVPRFEVEPHTWNVPVPVVTALHWLNVSLVLQALAPALKELRSASPEPRK